MSQGVLESTSLAVKIRDVLRAIPLSAEVGEPPTDADGDDVPYAICYPIDNDGEDATLGLPHATATLIVQITYVWRTTAQAATVADRARRALLGQTAGVYVNSLNTPYLAVGGRWSLGVGALDSEGRLHSVQERFGFLATAL